MTINRSLRPDICFPPAVSGADPWPHCFPRALRTLHLQNDENDSTIEMMLYWITVITVIQGRPLTQEHLMAAQRMRTELDINYSPFFKVDIATIARCLNFTSSSLRNISKRSNMLLWWGLSSWMFSSGWRVWEHNDIKFGFKKNRIYHLTWRYQSFPACW